MFKITALVLMLLGLLLVGIDARRDRSQAPLPEDGSVQAMEAMPFPPPPAPRP